MPPIAYARMIGVKGGEDCWISTRNFSTESNLVEIGNHVRIAGGTTFFTHGGITMLRKYYDYPQLDRFGKI